MHLQVDGLVSRVLTKDEAYEAIHSLVTLAHMTPVGDFVYRDTHLGPSGYQLLMESHACFDYINDYLCVDLFSCNPFDRDIAADFIKSYFLITSVMRDEVIERGFHPTIQ